MSYKETIQKRIEKNKIKILEALNDNHGIVWLACDEIGINRSTFYRWMERDDDFKKKAEEKIFVGRKFRGDNSLYQIWKTLKTAGDPFDFR